MFCVQHGQPSSSQSISASPEPSGVCIIHTWGSTEANNCHFNPYFCSGKKNALGCSGERYGSELRLQKNSKNNLLLKAQIPCFRKCYSCGINRQPELSSLHARLLEDCAWLNCMEGALCFMQQVAERKGSVFSGMKCWGRDRK